MLHGHLLNAVYMTDTAMFYSQWCEIWIFLEFWWSGL